MFTSNLIKQVAIDSAKEVEDRSDFGISVQLVAAFQIELEYKYLQ
jgi:hypothetical protein